MANRRAFVRRVTRGRGDSFSSSSSLLLLLVCLFTKGDLTKEKERKDTYFYHFSILWEGGSEWIGPVPVGKTGHPDQLFQDKKKDESQKVKGELRIYFTLLYSSTIRWASYFFFSPKKKKRREEEEGSLFFSNLLVAIEMKRRSFPSSPPLFPL